VFQGEESRSGVGAQPALKSARLLKEC